MIIFFTDKQIIIKGGKIYCNHHGAQASEIVTLNAEADDYHVFDNWTVTDSKGKAIEITDKSFVMPEDDVAVSASFTLRKCNVSFDPNEGSGEMKPVQADIGTLFTLPASRFLPPDEDMLFDCWIVIFKDKESVEKKAGDYMTE